MKLSVRNPEQVVSFLEEYIEERFYKSFFKAFKETIDCILTSRIEQIEELTENECIFLHFLPLYLSAINEVKLTQNEIANMFRTGFKIDNIEFVKLEFIECIKPYLVELEEAENIYKISISNAPCNVYSASLNKVVYELTM